MLYSLSIDNYRLFKHFEIESLSNVNLIVGTNNSGKSSLLEAVSLLTSDDVRSSLIYLLGERGEYVSGTVDLLAGRGTRGGFQISHLFHGHSPEFGQTIRIASNDKQRIDLKIAILQSKDDRIPETNQLSSPNLPFWAAADLELNEQIGYLIFEHSQDKAEPTRLALQLATDGVILARPYGKPYGPSALSKSRLITTNYLDYNELAALWDRITLTPKEDQVIEALRILDPDVQRISFTSRRTSNSGILLRLADQEEPIPLGSMGDGMRRILAIAASLVSVDDGALLVDEIDTGLYYAVLKDMWKLVLKTAHKQNAQVFATTHSWDCVKAFQQALSEFHDDSFGRLIRLDRSDDQIRAVSYLADELNIAIEQNIEVR